MEWAGYFLVLHLVSGTYKVHTAQCYDMRGDREGEPERVDFAGMDIGMVTLPVG